MGRPLHHGHGKVCKDVPRKIYPGGKFHRRKGGILNFFEGLIPKLVDVIRSFDFKNGNGTNILIC